MILILKMELNDSSFDNQGVSSFLNVYVKPILLQNDELIKENNRFTKLLKRYDLNFDELERLLKHYCCNTISGDMDNCGTCNHKFFCNECDEENAILCEKCGMITCFDCIEQCYSENICKNCYKKI